jgi:hypothetical protein
MKRGFLLPAVVLAVSMGTVGWLGAQSGTRGPGPSGSGRVPRGSSGSGQRSTPRAERPFEQQLWEYLQQAQYRNWAPLAGQTAEAYEGSSPHGALVKLYANRRAAASSADFPHGSLLVKENYDATGKRLLAITAMYRSDGYAPAAGDWYWAKFEPSGEVSLMGDTPVAGRVGMCVECHESAAGGDYVFANDP